VQASLEACGFDTRSQIVWAKNNFAIGRGHYHCKHEPCWYAVRKGATGQWAGDHKQTTVWDIDKNLKSETGHGKLDGDGRSFEEIALERAAQDRRPEPARASDHKRVSSLVRE
jgi:hypothetical protein